MSVYVLCPLMTGLALGTAIAFASSHWFVAWMGLEINTLAILPIMAKLHHPRGVEATIKYFLIQACAAAVFIFAGISNAWYSGQWDMSLPLHPVPATLLTAALALKMGLAPLHFWLPEVIQGLDLTTGLILSTWQKLAPFAILIQIEPASSSVPFFLGVMSVLVGGWGGLNQTQLRKILAYSSIAHLGWMVLIIHYSPHLAVLALFTYFIMTFSAFMLFKLNKATNVNSLAISWAKNPALTALVPLTLLSLAGLPPLTGFAPKWLILADLCQHNLGLLATFTAMTALLSLYFYLRLAYAITLTMSPNNLPGTTPWRLFTTQATYPLALATMASTLLLPLGPLTATLLIWQPW